MRTISVILEFIGLEVLLGLGADNNESFFKDTPYTSQSQIVQDLLGIDNREKK